MPANHAKTRAKQKRTHTHWAISSVVNVVLNLSSTPKGRLSELLWVVGDEKLVPRQLQIKLEKKGFFEKHTENRKISERQLNQMVINVQKSKPNSTYKQKQWKKEA